ncbi:hypothetical protein CLF_112548 [Clonorchis sinensis]|uniref:GIY-YIG domain-containing protein n=1 Tax=Clonorchis sinensis TaxID=79923 RepID=G7YMK2_CLOSI|nr:hypothetical protein CLF_112548 [Clonorchis sinensis]
MSARHLRQYGITVAFKPANALRKTLSKPKGRLDARKKTNVVYRLRCNDCDKHYVGQTGRKLATRIHEHKLASRRHDPMSLVPIHEDKEGHKFILNNVQILAHARTKREREFAEAWYSTQKSINKHIDIDPVYQPLQQKNYTVTGLWATWTIKKPNDNQRTNGSKGRNPRKTRPLNQPIKKTNPDLKARRKRPNHNRTITHKTVELNTPNEPNRHKRLRPGQIHKGPIKLGKDPIESYQMLF